MVWMLFLQYGLDHICKSCQMYNEKKFFQKWYECNVSHDWLNHVSSSCQMCNEKDFFQKTFRNRMNVVFGSFDQITIFVFFRMCIRNDSYHIIYIYFIYYNIYYIYYIYIIKKWKTPPLQSTHHPPLKTNSKMFAYIYEKGRLSFTICEKFCFIVNWIQLHIIFTIFHIFQNMNEVDYNAMPDNKD